MNILVVVDEFPFPPRNGVTIPVANIIEGFVNRGCRVDLLLLDISNNGFPDDSVWKSLFTGVALIPLGRLNEGIGLIKELVGFRGLFQAWKISGDIECQRMLQEYDIVWSSPIRAVGLWFKFQKILGISGKITIAAINDSYTLTLAELSRRKERKFDKFLFRLRAHAMDSIERRLLKMSDIVCVQSQREIDFFGKVFSKQIAPLILEVKNGVAEIFFQVRKKNLYDLLFVGSLDSFYLPTLEWFIDEVYTKFSVPRPTFKIVGRGASNDLRLKFTNLGIAYSPFVEDIASVYSSSKILVAPIFKGYGTINKVIEGMASGCVVVGDNTAFNGLENFVHQRDGFVAETPEEFMSWIRVVLPDSDLADRIGANARNLIRRDFSWDSRVELIFKTLQCLH